MNKTSREEMKDTIQRQFATMSKLEADLAAAQSKVADLEAREKEASDWITTNLGGFVTCTNGKQHKVENAGCLHCTIADLEARLGEAETENKQYKSVFLRVAGCSKVPDEIAAQSRRIKRLEEALNLAHHLIGVGNYENAALVISDARAPEEP